MLDFSRLKITLISLVCLFGIVTALPNGFSEQQLAGWPDWAPTEQVTLGLDLQGGTYMQLEVDMAAVVENKLDNLRDEVRQALRDEKIGYTGLGVRNSAVSLRLRDEAQRPAALTALEALSQPIVSNVLTAPVQELEVSELEGDQIEIRFTEAGLQARKVAAVNQTLEVIRRRIDAMGTREPTIQREGEDRILLQLPGIGDTQEIRKILETVAVMTFNMVDETTSAAEAERGRIPPGSLLLPMTDGGNIVVLKRTRLSGENLVSASQSFDQNGLPVVAFKFDARGGKIFGDLTLANVNKRFAIVLDGEVISAPVIQTPILGGSGIIRGNFTIQSATNLAILISAGALPAPIRIEEERTVGPDLGADSIEAGKWAAVIGLICVIVYIILSYGWFGVVADIALLINIALIAGILSTIGATLTLPGIAGIVLTIGMAVDANVLVFERIREEVRNGRSSFSAMETGYSQALSTILDANITTLIAALILFQFGSGPIKGFAITLAVGIITSVFTAVMVTRLMLVLWLKRTRPETLKV